jgi:formate hydrogenlyase transcriptional activator
MREKLLIVEDEFIVANDLRMMLVNAGYDVCGIAATVEAAKDWVEKSHPTWVLLDILLQEGPMGTDLARYLTEKNIGFIYLSANTNQSVLDIAKATQPYGFLVKPFRINDLLIMLDIARSKHLHNLQLAAQRALMYKNQLRHIVKFASSHEQFFSFIPGLFQSLIPFDLMRISVRAPKRNKTADICFLQTGFEEYEMLSNAELGRITGSPSRDTKSGPIDETHEAQLLNGQSFQQQLASNAVDRSLSRHFRLESKLNFIQALDEESVIFSFYSRKPDAYSRQQLDYLDKSGQHLRELASALSRAMQQKGSPVLLRAARISVSPTIPTEEKFPGVIGKSSELLQVVSSVELVANTPVSVLIMGESGTGKEQIARSIHNLSSRREKKFVTVNCAALPTELIESELFGHEKGAFTGAIEKRVGKFEIANGGTIFLDEIGELPLGSQVKLLRVLQEMEFEPVGSSKTIKVDVRVVAATNRDLEKEVAANKFRLDLYYRLNVYPISLPPLRSRKADIPLLAAHFLQQAALTMGRAETPEISPSVVQRMEKYNWPGNIRELKHLMARTIIRTQGPAITEIELPADHLPAQPAVGRLENEYKTLEQMEADYILQVLRDCKGKVFGTGGAAEILGLPVSTLASRMKKLGIKKESYYER